MRGLDKLGHQEAATLKQQFLFVRMRRGWAGPGRHQGFNRSLPLVVFIGCYQTMGTNPPPGCSGLVKMFPVAHAIK